MSYAFVIYTDVKTGLQYESKPTILERIKEDIEIMRRHVKEDLITFQIERIDGTYEFLKEKYPYIESRYRPNPFNASKKKDMDYIMIPKDPDDPRDLPWKIIIDNQKEEIKWVNNELDFIGNRFYQLCLDNHTEHYKIYGSLSHRGMIIKIFDYQHNSRMDLHRYWIELIGECFDPDKLSMLKSTDDESIYQQGFYTSEAKKICEYCETMFGIDKYKVASYLSKRDPSFFDGTKPDFNGSYDLAHIAAIHAENGDYDQALHYYQLAIDHTSNPHTKTTYGEKLKQFQKYYEAHGTTILSSFF